MRSQRPATNKRPQPITATNPYGESCSWDVGNVVVRWDPRTLYSQVFDDPHACDRFLATVCTMDWHVRHDRGVTFAQNRVALIERFPKHAPHIEADAKSPPRPRPGGL